MRTRIPLILAAASLWASPAFAHHAASGIVDEEIYAMIDELVADTPHADMTFDSMGGMTEMVITTDNTSRFEDLVESGLMTWVSLLDGEVTMTLEFDTSRRITITILQLEPLEKAGDAEPMSLDEVKAGFR